ncbi:MAG: hypothetical protein CL843_15465 [Crocinitomicaceae bacterium]|nr:hypothetical protein [Crocinitomicaceae bacterium]|tara:strand:- start:98 stop:505 length:408 start_codon:yes stop_codon:yes gene_type:complete
MKRFNFILQLILIIIAFVAGLLGAEGIILVLLVQFILGIYQLFNALIATISFRRIEKSVKSLKTYWIMVGVYFAGLAIVVTLFPNENIFDKVLLFYILSAWIIALYYLRISYRMLKEEKRDRKGFLPNLDSYFQK